MQTEKSEKNSGTNIIHFYQYLFASKKTDLVTLLLVTFILPVVPYIYLFFKLINETDEHRRSFYGDGSMITLCAGILCSYFLIVIDYRNNEEKGKNIIINIVLVLAYVTFLLVFIECQLNFSRSWCFNKIVILFSAFCLLCTFFAAAYFLFYQKVDYEEIKNFVESKKRRLIEKKASKITATSDENKIKL